MILKRAVDRFSVFSRLCDANVILRYLLGDHPELSPMAKAFFAGVRAVEHGAYVAESVVVGCVYVMQRVYEVPRPEIAEKLTALLGFRRISGEQIALLRHALALYAEAHVSFVDALIAAMAIAKGLPVETYDKALNKVLAR